MIVTATVLAAPTESELEVLVKNWTTMQEVDTAHQFTLCDTIKVEAECCAHKYQAVMLYHRIPREDVP